MLSFNNICGIKVCYAHENTFLEQIWGQFQETLKYFEGSSCNDFLLHKSTAERDEGSNCWERDVCSFVCVLRCFMWDVQCPFLRWLSSWWCLIMAVCWTHLLWALHTLTSAYSVTLDTVCVKRGFVCVCVCVWVSSLLQACIQFLLILGSDLSFILSIHHAEDLQKTVREQREQQNNKLAPPPQPLPLAQTHSLIWMSLARCRHTSRICLCSARNITNSQGRGEI